MKTATAIFLFFLSFNVLSQNYFEGIILDKATKEPIVGASIRNPETNLGTISNIDGEFQIGINASHDFIEISHLAYKAIRINTKDINVKSIYLESASITLPEAAVGNPAITLINLVIKKAIEQKEEKHFYKSFYQKTSLRGNKYNKLHEMFFEMCWTTEGVQLWKPLKTRYAELERQKYTFQNFLFSSFLQTIIIGNYSSFPLCTENTTENYDYRIVKYINEGTKDEIAVIFCKPKKITKNKRSFKGELYVDTHSELLLSIKGVYDHNKTGKWRAENTVEALFEKVNGKAELKYVYNEHWSKKVFSTEENVEKAWIYCTQNISELSKGKSYTKNEVEDDITFFKNTTYDKTFWDNAVPVYNTKLEKEIIAYFEKKGSFKGNL